MGDFQCQIAHTNPSAGTLATQPPLILNSFCRHCFLPPIWQEAVPEDLISIEGKWDFWKPYCNNNVSCYPEAWRASVRGAHWPNIHEENGLQGSWRSLLSPPAQNAPHSRAMPCWTNRPRKRRLAASLPPSTRLQIIVAKLPQK